MLRPPLISRGLLATTLAATLISFGCSSSGGPPSAGSTPSAQDTAAPTQPAPVATPTTSAEEALRNYVQVRFNQGFVADCDKAQRPDDVGKQCAKLRGKRGDLIAYALGPTFSDATRIVILKPDNGQWTLLLIENIDPASPTGIPWPLEVGADVVVAGAAPDCLKIREAPGTGSRDVGCMGDGEAATIVGGPVLQDDIEWWQLEGKGWAAGDYLRYPDQAPAATPTPQS